MFPNKLRCENFNQRLEFFGERKIVTLFKEDVIKECRDTKQSVDYYKNIKDEIKLIVKQQKKIKKLSSNKFEDCPLTSKQ